MSMDTKGGRVWIEINGQRYSARATVTIMPNTVELENGANMDGGGYSITKPVLARMECTFDRGDALGLTWSDQMILSRVNVTVQEMGVGTTHLFTGARFSGRPSLDTSTGEVSGLSVETDTYQSV